MRSKCERIDVEFCRYTMDWSTSLSAARFLPVSRVTCIQLTFDRIDGVAVVPCCCDCCAMAGGLDVSEANDVADCSLVSQISEIPHKYTDCVSCIKWMWFICAPFKSPPFAIAFTFKVRIFAGDRVFFGISSDFIMYT